MNNKSKILNISLVILLVLSLAGTFILFNQFSKAKNTLADLQTQLNSSKAQLKSAQTDWKALQDSITDVQKKNKQLVSTASQAPVDPNKKLSSGMTLAHAKDLIDTQRRFCQQQGMSAADTKALLEQAAKDLGTTLDEISRLSNNVTGSNGTTGKQAVPSKGSTTSSGSKSTGGSSSGSSGGSYTRQQGVPGTYPKTSWDKNGDGISDVAQNQESEETRTNPGRTTSDDIGLDGGGN